MEPILISPSVEDGFRSSIDQRNLHNDAGDDENADEDGCVGSSHVSPLPNLMSIKRLRV
jgi:hypothetical protein